jgi:hypothetical protein
MTEYYGCIHYGAFTDEVGRNCHFLASGRNLYNIKAKAIPLHATNALGGRGVIKKINLWRYRL